jgi:two-component system nitrogen regulation response regulator GlnG
VEKAAWLNGSYRKQELVAHLLLIDNDPMLLLKQLRQAFPAPSHVVDVARSGEEGFKRIRSRVPDVVVLDLRLPDQSGLEVYRRIRQLDGRIPVIFVTVATSADAAIEAMQEGAYDYLFKPLDFLQLQQVVGEALEVARRMQESSVVAKSPFDPDADAAIVGTSSAMREVYKSIGRVASQNVPVLITGESGTGKELVAMAIYHHGPRARAMFRALNCAAIPETLLESELFGHEKGSFTGADRRRIGKFEQCNGGTLFLDEVGDMPLSLQSKLLRLLQEQAFERVGGNETVQTDVRLLAATNRDLKVESAAAHFRPDLYYRLSVFMIHVPPLRERGEDLPLLVQLYLRRFSRELGRDVADVAPEAMDRLRNYSWPGNIRELQSVLKQSLLHATGSVLLSMFLPSEIPAATGGSSTGARQVCRSGMTLAEIESEAIQQCLLQTGGDRRQTASLLGISARTLLRKIRKYRLADPLRPAKRPRALEATPHS